ncbi:hypothetical protein DL98DRAFT_623049 [Cadophora sp. DSE1049]|nr:hypothetical protein DL98DRAFT_623049 [Cadophora sp. DSE1049]
MSHYHYSNQGSSGQGYRSSGHPKITNHLQNPQGKRYREKELSFEVQQNANTFCSQIDTRLKRWEVAIMRGNIPHVTSQPDFLEIAMIWLRIFDHAFYFNLVRKGLRDKNPIVVYHNDKDDMLGFVAPTSQPFISLNMHFPHDDGSPGCVARQMIATLLHEMLHVFLLLYTCECNSCEKRATSRKRGGVKHKHGATWVNAMVPLERALQSQVRWKVETNTFNSVLMKMVGSGWVPRDDELERWGIDRSYLMYAVSLAPESRGTKAIQAMLANTEQEDEVENEDEVQYDGKLICICSVM